VGSLTSVQRFFQTLSRSSQRLLVSFNSKTWPASFLYVSAERDSVELFMRWLEAASWSELGSWSSGLEMSSYSMIHSHAGVLRENFHEFGRIMTWCGWHVEVFCICSCVLRLRTLYYVIVECCFPKLVSKKENKRHYYSFRPRQFMLKMCRTVIQNVCVQKDKAVNKTLDCFYFKICKCHRVQKLSKIGLVHKLAFTQSSSRLSPFLVLK